MILLDDTLEDEIARAGSDCECTKHPLEVPGYEGRLEELAEAIGNMTYDQTRDFIIYFSRDLARQSEADRRRERVKLSDRLMAAANKLYEASEHMGSAWLVCKPYMPKNDGSD
ncbi:hypothetical protein GOV10_05120, partial [Candidatus Woesearchaeota archaeon]|nr:hypothetical protein [Candidatus Woesearchaeota archaeon]